MSAFTDAQKQIGELDREVAHSREAQALAARLQAELALQQREIEELQRKQTEDNWPWQCWAIKRDGTEHLLATAPTRKECEAKIVEMQTDADPFPAPEYRIEYRQDSEAYVLRYQLAKAVEERKYWFAQYEVEQKTASQARFEQRSFWIALRSDVAPKIAEKALADLNVGKQALAYKSAKKAIERFVDLAKEWAAANANR